MPKLLSIFCVLGLAGLLGAQNSRLMTPSERNAFRIWQWSMVSYESLGKGLVRQTFRTRFQNQTLLEVMAVKVELVVLRNGAEVWRSKPVVLDNFKSEALPHRGSILPLTKTVSEPNVTVDRPSEFWTTADSVRLDMREVRVWNGKGGLNDAGHLYQYMAVTQTPELKLRFDRDPSLLKVRNEFGFSPILMAFAAADVDFIKYLEAKGLKATAKCTRGHDAMFIAAVVGNPSNLAYALKVGCNVNGRLPDSKRTPLIKAASAGSLGSVRWLLEHGANPDLGDVNHLTPLRAAVLEGQPEILQELVKGKANVHYRDPAGYGLMHDCVNNSLMFPYVAKLGISVDDRDPKVGLTPLMVAAKQGGRNSIVWLIQHGAKTDLKDIKGRTARDYSKLSNTLHSDEFYLKVVSSVRGAGN